MAIFDPDMFTACLSRHPFTHMTSAHGTEVPRSGDPRY